MYKYTIISLLGFTLLYLLGFLVFRYYNSTDCVESGGEPFVNGGLYAKGRMTITIIRKGDHWPYMFYPLYRIDKIITGQKTYIFNDDATEIDEL
jgi:hypothetical protein